MTTDLAAFVRRHDPDRFLTALFADARHREALLLLYAFNHELARAREVASEPTLALIRLQWWREVVEGAAKRHEIATPLRAALDGGALRADVLLGMIEAREMEADPQIATLADWRAYLLGSAGGVAVAAGYALGWDGAEALRPLGAAYGVAGVLRSASVLAQQGRSLLPEEAAGDLRVLADEGREFLRAAPAVPRSAIAAALPAVLARRDLRRMTTGPRGLGDRLAVTIAGVIGRI